MVCRKCRQERGDEFHRGHRQCKECHEAGQQERNRQRPAIRRWIRLKHLYNLTRESFAKLWENQSGKCAVCSVELTKPDVDHCHQTVVLSDDKKRVLAVVGLNGCRYLPNPDPDPMDEIMLLALDAARKEHK
jgi:hypothetical protein